MLNAKKKQLRTKSYCRDGKIKVRCYSWEIFSKSRKKEELMSITYHAIRTTRGWNYGLFGDPILIIVWSIQTTAFKL